MLDEIDKYTKSLTVLLVEDDENLRREVGGILEDFFAHVVYGVDGKDGLLRYKEFLTLHKHPFDIVITDIVMPNENGIALIENIVEILPQQPIIVISAYHDSHYLLDCINLGVAQFIMKPIEVNDFLDVIKKVSKKAQLNGFEYNQQKIIFAKDLVWYKDENRLTYHDKMLPLTRNEQIVMEFLIARLGQVCSIEEIINVMDRHNIQANGDSIRNVMLRLRKKLPYDIIVSVYGKGYQLTNI